ncbi:MAG: pilus assembly protein [Candidatus Peregrinibacteria bacterium]|nr:pilus assembly protein [Candidatus Peregrinibacteria bacterium]MDZ4244370.1 TadE family protein [Candidatus Gracilibacteria bacterium]
MFKLIINKRGQALVEFAVIFPLIIILLFGIYEIGIALSAQQTITYAAREGARVGALTNENSQIEGAIQAATEFIDESNSRITIQIIPESEATRNRGDELTIRIEYTMPLLILNIISNDITLTSQATARIEI